jgi:membrane protease YdiL (CAAX protease family)
VSTSGDPFLLEPERRPWPLAPEPEPVFGLGTVIAVFLGVMVALIVCGVLAIAVAHQLPSLRRVSTANLAQDPRVLLPAQLAAYALVIAGLWRWFGHHLRIGFLRALSFRWPTRALRFLAGGAVLGIAVQWVSNWLPSPPELPIDKMLRTPADAWIMSAFGVLIAPFAEEVFFRGLLFPALTRRTGAVVALLATALCFGAVHAEQLGDAWLQVACIAFVGGVLTLVRWRFHSVASSMLVHMGYNGVLFAVIFVQTRGFRHMSM